MDGDELRICFSLGTEAAAAFESKAGLGNRLLSLKRVKR